MKTKPNIAATSVIVTAAINAVCKEGLVSACEVVGVVEGTDWVGLAAGVEVGVGFGDAVGDVGVTCEELIGVEETEIVLLL